MDIHVQHCQKCNSAQLKNILLRENGEPDKVYVQCQNCGEFVASYIIAPMGYYHHGKGYESFLRGVIRSGEFSSGRNLQQIFVNRKESEVKKFEQAKKLLEFKEQDRKKPT